MAERSLFWNGVEGNKPQYQAEDFAMLIQQLIGTNTNFTKIGTGVGRYNSSGADGLRLSANSTNMITAMSAGFAFINGKMYINDLAKSHIHDAADAVNPRIDRVVIRYDALTQTIVSAIKKGNPAASPVAPALTFDGNTKEISIAQVRIVAGRSFITPTEVTDERADTSLCGYLPLHNIYRGLGISPEGVASLPNQSYVESTIVHASPFLTVPRHPTIGTLPIYTTNSGSNVFKDLQGEVTTAHKFIPKVAGVYIFTMYLRCQDFSFPANETIDLQSFLRKNGVEGSDTQAVIARRTNISGDNIFQGVAIESLNAGDEISFSLTHFGNPTAPVILNQQVRVTKLS